MGVRGHHGITLGINWELVIIIVNALIGRRHPDLGEKRHEIGTLLKQRQTGEGLECQGLLVIGIEGDRGGKTMIGSQEAIGRLKFQ